MTAIKKIEKVTPVTDPVMLGWLWGGSDATNGTSHGTGVWVVEGQLADGCHSSWLIVSYSWYDTGDAESYLVAFSMIGSSNYWLSVRIEEVELSKEDIEVLREAIGT